MLFRSKEVTTPTKEGAVDLEGEGRMLGEIGSGEEMQERREEQKPLVTRYVRVEGLSRDTTEEELRELFVVRSPLPSHAPELTFRESRRATAPSKGASPPSFARTASSSSASTTLDMLPTRSPRSTRL